MINGASRIDVGAVLRKASILETKNISPTTKRNGANKICNARHFRKMKRKLRIRNQEIHAATSLRHQLANQKQPPAQTARTARSHKDVWPIAQNFTNFHSGTVRRTNAQSFHWAELDHSVMTPRVFVNLSTSRIWIRGIRGFFRSFVFPNDYPQLRIQPRLIEKSSKSRSNCTGVSNVSPVDQGVGLPASFKIMSHSTREHFRSILTSNKMKVDHDDGGRQPSAPGARPGATMEK